MQDQELRGDKKVDTLRVALLGFSLISTIVFSFFLFYITLQYAANFEEFLPDTSEISRALVRLFKVLLIFVLILPHLISFIVWFVTPSFVKRWYNLQTLPPEYNYIHDSVQKIASKMGISPPNLLYTQKDIANCFNLGRTERESTIVISKWLACTLHSDQLEAVLIHEMAHTKNRDVTLMAYFSAVKRVIVLFPLFFLLSFLYIPLHFGEPLLWWVNASELSALFLVFFGCLLFVCILIVFGIQWFSRLREVAADARVSLFTDKNILKRTLYMLACARSMRMLFVSSSLMISGPRWGGILSTHPPLNERYFNLDKKRFIIDTSKPLPLTFCFTTALSMLLFTTFITYVIAAPCLFITQLVDWITWLAFLFPVIIGGLLVSYCPYLSLKYIGIIIILITVISSVFYFGLMVFLYVNWAISTPPPPYMPPGCTAVMDATGIGWNVDWIATIIYLLRQRILFGILTFLITILLRFVKKVYMTQR